MATKSNNKAKETSVQAIVVKHEVRNGGESSGSVQISKGAQFRFAITNQKEADAFCTTEEFEGANGQTIEFDQLHTTDGDTLALSQVIRRRNGLDLKGNTNQERFESFFNMVKDAEDGLTLQVDEVVEAVFSVTNENGEKEERKSRQFKFEVL